MEIISIDTPFYLAVAAFGWGLSLATYRLFAGRYGWPMGQWHSERPMLASVIGWLSVVVAGLFAFTRVRSGYNLGALAIPVLGFALAVVWTTFLRVGSQVSLLIAPAAAALLVFSWFG
jgi:hypothetical protein